LPQRSGIITKLFVERELVTDHYNQRLLSG